MITFLLMKLKGCEFIIFTYIYLVLCCIIMKFFGFFPFVLFTIVLAFSLMFLSLFFVKRGYRFWILFGLPGSGKTTTAVDLASRYLKKKRPVFANFDLKCSSRITKVELTINNSKLHDCAIFIDEAGLDFDNRNFKSNFSPDMLKLFKYHRKLHIDFYFFSQDVDVDIKLRKLCNGLFYIKKSSIPFFVVYKRIKFSIAVDKVTKQLITAYKFVLFSGKYVFMPKTWKKFNTEQIM